MPAAIAEATKDNFRDLVSEGRVLVDLWGTSCQTCLALMPHVERLADERPDLKVVKLEAPKARRLCIELKVMGLPAFLLFEDGEEVDRLAAPDLSASGLESWLDQALAARRKE
ncbi:MAG: thioredoxin family protein [Actinomycetota bacterium]|nr:thioredoxin family protein [Actinomycetota bacterium]